MAFTHTLGQNPAWKKALLADVKAVTGKKVRESFIKLNQFFTFFSTLRKLCPITGFDKL